MIDAEDILRKYLPKEAAQDYLDVAYGANRTLNGLTGGGLDYLGDRFGVDTQMNDYLRLLSPKERQLRQGLGKAAFFGGGALGLNAGLRAIPTLGNEIMRLNGRRELVNQLKRGRDFEDIYFGRLPKNKFNDLNKLRQGLQQPQLGSSRVTIPADRVEHIYERRILDNNYQPKETADTIYKALFGKNSKIYPDKKYGTLQHLINQETIPNNCAIVGKIRNGENIFVKTGFKVKK